MEKGEVWSPGVQVSPIPQLEEHSFFGLKQLCGVEDSMVEKCKHIINYKSSEKNGYSC